MMPATLRPLLALLTSTGSHLSRPLLSLVIRICRLCLSVARGHITPALCSWPAWLCRILSTFAWHRGESRIRLHGSEPPGSMVDNSATPGERVTMGQTQEHRSVQETPAPRPAIDWQKMLSRLQERSSNIQLRQGYEASHATPDKGSQRYGFDKSRMAKLDTLDKFNIKAGQRTLLQSPPSLPEDNEWQRYVHPEGIALFYHKEFHIFTELDVSDSMREKELLACAAKLVEKAIELKTEGVTLDNFTHIVLNVDDDKKKWYYYFVDHTNRLVFWVDDVTPSDLKIDLQKISGYNHIKYMVEVHYWTHCEYYPYNVLPEETFVNLRGMFNYAKIDMITTDSSSSPFGQDELVAMSGFLDSMKGVKEIADPYSIWAIARLMGYFIEGQFLNFYGQPCARLNADNALFEKMNWNREFWFKVLNVLLLGSPNEHALRLQRVWVDGMIIQPRWKDFVNRLTTELARYTIFSTVMLAVNFSFLAVPGVITVGSAAGKIQIIIYCSIVSTIASIVFSFGLLNIYSNPRLLIVRNALEAMWRLSQRTMGMAGLAITHSLPIAALIWSIALFSVALAVQIFGPKERATVSALSVEFCVIVVFVSMGVSVMWGFSENDTSDTSAEKDAGEGSAGRRGTFSSLLGAGHETSNRNLEEGRGTLSRLVCCSA